jgi:hypothetical protein
LRSLFKPAWGPALLLEGVPEQITQMEDAIVSSSVVAASSLFSSWFLQPYVLPLPAVREEEVLDWDFHIDTAPQRPSGTLTVVLKYSGRSAPTPLDNPWD